MTNKKWTADLTSFFSTRKKKKKKLYAKHIRTKQKGYLDAKLTTGLFS